MKYEPCEKSQGTADNLALIRADYEAGLCSKRKVAKMHNISTVTLWRYATEEGWEYGLKRNAVSIQLYPITPKTPPK